jgi:hypothetical protein
VADKNTVNSQESNGDPTPTTAGRRDEGLFQKEGLVPWDETKPEVISKAMEPKKGRQKKGRSGR